MSTKKIALNEKAMTLIDSLAKEFPTIGDLTEAVCGKSPKIRNKMVLVLSEALKIPKGLLKCDFHENGEVTIGLTINANCDLEISSGGDITHYLPNDDCATVQAETKTKIGIVKILELFKITSLRNLQRKVVEARMIITAYDNLMTK